MGEIGKLVVSFWMCCRLTAGFHGGPCAALVGGACGGDSSVQRYSIEIVE